FSYFLTRASVCSRLGLGRPPGGGSAARFDKEAQRVAVGCSCCGAIRPHAIHGGKHFPLLQHRREIRRSARGPLDLKMDQTVERDRCRHLALDKRVELADVAGYYRRQPKRPAGIPPRQAAGNMYLTAMADALAKGGRRGLGK